MEAYTSLDRLEIRMSGGASNTDEGQCLGGGISSFVVKGVIPRYTTAVQGLIIEEASPANGEGTASIAISGDDATYTPPDGNAGSAVTITVGQRKLLLGEDTDKGVRIRRVSDQTFKGTAQFELADAIQGVLSGPNVSDANRQAGYTLYRAIFLYAQADVENVTVWITTDGQSSWAVGEEQPDSNDEIQYIPGASVAPLGVSFVSAISQATAIQLGTLLQGECLGLWIRRTFPASGVVAASEQVNFHLHFEGV